ncbi:unnamed protein product [Scytosiphon promiscuus]
MVPSTGSARPTVMLFRFRSLELLVLLLLLLEMQVQMPFGFLVPAPPRRTGNPPRRSAGVAREFINRPPMTSPRYAAGSATAAAAEAEATSDATANGAGTETGTDDDSAGAGLGAAAAVTGARADGDPSPFLSEFQEFVERRRAGARKVVLDLRSSKDFRREHLEGSTSIPVDELEARLLELPPPFAQPVSIVGNQEERRAAGEFLTKKGWKIGEEIGPDLVGATGDDDEARAWPTEAGWTSVQVWRANDFLEFCTERFLLRSPSASSAHDDGAAAVNDGGLVLDLGCGSGRDTVYMAQHLPPGTRVIGVDNHSYALERGARLANQWLEASASSEGCTHGGGEVGSNGGKGQARTRGEKAGSGSEEPTRGGSARTVAEGSGGENEGDSGATRGGPPDAQQGRACEWLLADLRKEGSLDGLRASVVHGHRFKCEQLLPLLRDDVLLPGGYFIWSTFLDTGKENAVPPWRPSRMMRPGELAGIFSGDGFEILVDEEGELPTRGSVVPANFFACRKA